MLLDTPICDFGWKAPDFTLKDPGGTIYSMTRQMGENGLIVVFISNHCPYVIAIIDRMVDDANLLKDRGINFMAVMSNDYSDYPADSPPMMVEYIKKHNIKFPYVIDEDQKVAKAYGAVCTPDFFGLNNSGELQYRGRLDDKGKGDRTGRITELVNAMIQIGKTGKGPTQQFPSMGCSIKWTK